MPEQPSSLPQQIISLGRGAKNTVVLNESNVSTQHARLLIDDGEIILEDLGSTNGTAVGKVENKINRATVQTSDTIFLGSTAYQVSDLIQRAQSTSFEVITTPTSHGVSTPSRNHRPVVLSALAAGVLVVLGIGWMVVRDPGANRSATAEPSSQTPVALAPLASEQVADEQVASEPVASGDRSPQLGLEPAEVVLSPAEVLAKSLFVIVCTDPQRETPFRVGTGFAMDAKHVVTSAAVVQTMRELQQNGFAEAFLYSPEKNAELIIDSMTTHPQYEIANRQARQAQQEHDALFDNLESKPPTPEAFETVKDQLLAARSKALQAIDQKTTYDAAIITLAEPLTHWLPAVDSDVVLRPNQKLETSGYAFDLEDPYFDRSVPVELASMPSRVGQLARSSTNAPPMLLGKAGPQQYEVAYLGSPILNSQAQVVGIYSRPTPSHEVREKEVEPTFDAALFQRARECLAELP